MWSSQPSGAPTGLPIQPTDGDLLVDGPAQAAEAGCRYALGHIIDRSLALVEYLRKKGPKAVHNMDTLLLRESMDVIGETPLFQSSCLLDWRATMACHKGTAWKAEDCRRRLAERVCRRRLTNRNKIPMARLLKASWLSPVCKKSTHTGSTMHSVTGMAGGMPRGCLGCRRLWLPGKQGCMEAIVHGHRHESCRKQCCAGVKRRHRKLDNGFSMHSVHTMQ